MRRQAWAAVAALAVLVSGCGGSDDEPRKPAAGSGSPPPSESATLPDSAPTPTPTVEPATGVALDVEGINVRAPGKWRQTNDTIFVDTALGPDGTLMLSVAGSDQLSLRAAERYFWDSNEPPAGYRPQETVVMGGLTAGYYTARDRFDDIHVVTFWDSGYVVKVELRLHRDVSAGRQRELLGSVVASYGSPRTA